MRLSLSTVAILASMAPAAKAAVFMQCAELRMLPNVLSGEYGFCVVSGLLVLRCALCLVCPPGSALLFLCLCSAANSFRCHQRSHDYSL